MSYSVLARRYRSRSFDEVVGQEPIARTLRSAIEQGRVAHAYLFTGTRGVGKTSMARIFAKALNAPGDNPPDVAEAIMKGRDTDVIELDAASNRGIDDAREVIASAVYRPLRGRYKVYIIDEVHMLTREAFNALLKTMEEPPDHVVFILCTTESHKVPATIQSRCQRFDFRNISTAGIADHLAEVVTREAHTADAELVHAVARLAAGSMRDGLSLMDRLMAAGQKHLTLDLLEELLGLPDRQVLGAMIAAMADGDIAGALKRCDELLCKGIGVEQLLMSLAERLRDLMVMSACGPETDLVELTGDSRSEAVALAGRFDAAGLVHMIALCDAAARNGRSSPSARAVLDALVVRMALTEKIADVTAIVAGSGASTCTGAGARNGSAAAKKR
ncbi:MAG: DNA polymerase III subunit gamma/tau [Phycisphaerales bacterium]|nr:DNA polymerase III subunit gamma/tau [Phycisphaerales bacterium]